MIETLEGTNFSKESTPPFVSTLWENKNNAFDDPSKVERDQFLEIMGFL